MTSNLIVSTNSTKNDKSKVNNFIARHNIITATICIIIGSCINELVNEFFDGVVLCVIEEKKNPNKKFEELEVTVFNKKIRIGKLIILVLKLFIIILIVIVLEKLLEKTL